MRGPIAPMLAVPGELPADPGGWSVEIKWDGVRAVVRTAEGRHRLWSRNLIDRTAAWPELAGLPDALGGADAVIDGEVVVLDASGRPSFGAVAQRMHVSDEGQARRLADGGLAATLMIFDLLEVDGQATFDLALSERRRLLEALVTPGPSWRISPTNDDPAGLMAAARDADLEGVLCKRSDSTYRPGRRSSAWRKVKVDRRDDFVVGGWFPGEGRRAGSLGALALGQVIGDDRPDRLRFVGRVGTGFDDRTLADLHRRLTAAAADRSPFVAGHPGPSLRPVRPSMVVEVRYGEWTNDGVLRHPSFLRVVDEPPG